MPVIGQDKPTIGASASFAPKEDVNVLHKAMKGIGSNKTEIINILCKRSNAQVSYKK